MNGNVRFGEFNRSTGAIVWRIRPDVIPNWTRPPVIAHSQVGYAPGFSKVAVLELDPKYDAPKTAKVLRLMEDGSYKPVFEGPITPSTPWLRYVYSKFDFTPLKDPGLYVIEYADQRTAPFPISSDVYANIWQDSLDHHLAAQMDHVSVREGYRVWHAISHLDDGRMAPVVGEQFDGWNQATATDGKYKGGDHIIKPDFPECIDDYGFLWFEDEAVVAGSASWVVAGNAAEAIVRESK